MPSPNLNIAHVASNQNQKEVTINDAVDALDRALTEIATVDVSGGNATVADATYRAAVLLKVTGATTAGRTVTLPQIKRLVAVLSDSANTQDVTLVRGATTLTLPKGKSTIVYTDGTADGLFEVSSVGSGGGVQIATYVGGLTVSTTILAYVASENVELPANFTGSQGYAWTTPTADTTLDVQKNGASVGSITFSSGSTTATFSAASAVPLAPGDRLTVITPAALNGLDNIALNLLATRT